MKNKTPKIKYIIHARVGDCHHPAGDSDIKDIKRILAKVLSKKAKCIVTHHAVEINVLPVPN